MKALIKSGVCLTLSWLASGAAAQDVNIKWQAASKPKADPAVRPVTLSQPMPLDGSGGAGASFRPIVRMQAPDDKTVPPVPTLEIGGNGDKDKQPKKMPQEKGFTPPPPQPVPSPIFSQLVPDGDCLPESCGLDGCGRGGWFRGCPDGPRFYMGAEMLMWWQKGQGTPPLITSNPIGTPTAQTGLITTNNTSVLYDSVPNYVHGGGRFTLGAWLPHFCCNLGIETRYFFLARQGSTAVFTSLGDPQLSRPFTDTVVGANAEPFAVFNRTDRATGTATVSDYTQLWGIDTALRYKCWRGDRHWLDVLAGYRYLSLSEGLSITEDRHNTIVNGLANNIHVFEQESFRTRNQFNGAQIGLDGECRVGARWFVGMNTRVSFGNIHQIVNIDGSTTYLNVPAPLINGTVPGALLASPTNMGRYTRDRFAVVPEVGLKIGVDITDNLRLFAGYDFMYISNVARPGEQIDPNVNQSFRNPPLPLVANGTGQRLPAVLFRTSDYWAQGFNFGLMYKY